MEFVIHPKIPFNIIATLDKHTLSLLPCNFKFKYENLKKKMGNNWNSRYKHLYIEFRFSFLCFDFEINLWKSYK